MNKLDVLKQLNVGNRVAEQESENLKDYFLKTNIWDQILSGEVEVIFGSKGSGKSALYNYLSTNSYSLIDHDAILALAENPKGSPAFKDFSNSPPTSDFEYQSIWKLYFILIATNKLFEFNYEDSHFNYVSEKLQESDLIARKGTFASLIKMVRDYINRITLEPNVTINEYSGVVQKFGLKVSLSEPSVKHSDIGIVSLDELLEQLNHSLQENGNKLWIAIDRLDAVFQDNFELEAHALRTLFQVYIDMQGYDNIKLIIFLRDDIWSKIIEKGFRESSHITKSNLITWNSESLFDLLLSRIEFNVKLLEFLGVTKPTNKEQRNALFYRIFPNILPNRASFGIEWLFSKIKDGNNVATPRELIQVINASIHYEIKRINDGFSQEEFISLDAIYVGLKEASKTKLETLFSEYPTYKTFINRLKGKKKVRLKIEDLREIWECGKKDAKIISNGLLKIGFFKNENESSNDPMLQIPFIYRPALNLQNELNL